MYVEKHCRACKRTRPIGYFRGYLCRGFRRRYSLCFDCETHKERQRYQDKYRGKKKSGKSRRDTQSPKWKAKAFVASAVRYGKLKRLPCEICGVEPTHGHH